MCLKIEASHDATGKTLRQKLEVEFLWLDYYRVKIWNGEWKDRRQVHEGHKHIMHFISKESTDFVIRIHQSRSKLNNNTLIPQLAGQKQVGMQRKRVCCLPLIFTIICRGLSRGDIIMCSWNPHNLKVVYPSSFLPAPGDGLRDLL